jgi:hypothetical protein
MLKFGALHRETRANTSDAYEVFEKYRGKNEKE